MSSNWTNVVDVFIERSSFFFCFYCFGFHPDAVTVQDIVVIVNGITEGAGTDGPVRRMK